MQTVRICFVGNSMVNGTGDPACLGWSGRICVAAMRAGHDVTHYNLGIRRDTSANILTRWSEEVQRRLPEGVDGQIVFSFGLNDIVIEGGKQRISTEESVGNLRAILAEAQRAYPVLMVGPPPMLFDDDRGAPVAELSAQYGVACRQLGVPYLEVFAALEKTGTFVREALDNDGAHPRAAGYAEMAELVMQWDAWQSWFR
ncbi:MAG: GDSL-type esterase/lipase family protein [Dehalococcoidia bacterium]